MFDFGISIQSFVSPLLNLFTKVGFAPFLAFVILVIAVLVALDVYFHYVLSAEIALKNAVKILSDIKDPTDFAAKFNEIDTAVSSVLCIKHSWSEFKETLIRPDDHISIYRNAIRPIYFININQVEAQLRLKRLHFFSNLLIGIGLLLTFLGLVAALTEAGKAIGNGGDDFQEPIRNLLSVAAFKFWTSVSGLGSSILLRIFYEIQNTHIKDLLNKINSGLERGLQFVSSEYIAVEQLHEAREQSAAMKRFSTELAVSMAKEIQPVFASALAPVHESLKDIGQRITGGIGDAIKDAAGSEMHELSSNLGGIVHSLSNLKSEMDMLPPP